MWERWNEVRWEKWERTKKSNGNEMNGKKKMENVNENETEIADISIFLSIAAILVSFGCCHTVFFFSFLLFQFDICVFLCLFFSSFTRSYWLRATFEFAFFPLLLLLFTWKFFPAEKFHRNQHLWAMCYILKTTLSSLHCMNWAISVLSYLITVSSENHLCFNKFAMRSKILHFINTYHIDGWQLELEKKKRRSGVQKIRNWKWTSW